jgi:hypothetical protein
MLENIASKTEIFGIRTQTIQDSTEFKYPELMDQETSFSLSEPKRHLVSERSYQRTVFSMSATNLTRSGIASLNSCLFTEGR